jgi:hypothetical protein
MKARKVLNVRTHLGGLHGKTSFDAKKDGAEMEVSPAGVLITALGGKPVVRDGEKIELLIPWPNCTEVILEPETETRGPGRPPGPKAA